jgi:hypothetical protein
MYFRLETVVTPVLLCAGIVILVTACGSSNTSQMPAQEPKGGIMSTIAPSTDVIFTIESAQSNEDDTCTILAHDKRHESNIGIKVTVPKSVNAGVMQRVRIESPGPAGDSFVNYLAKLYEVKTKPGAMRKEIGFSGLLLGESPYDSARYDLDKHKLDFKLFYGENDPDESKYCEFYLNIDMAKKRMEMLEKDPDYAEAIIKALSIAP